MILNIGFCLNLPVGEALVVVVGNLVVIGSVVVVLAGEKDYRNEAKQSGRWE